jgi:thiamine-phosphate pyrophosphorylase
MVAFETLLRTARRLNARAGRNLPPLIFMTDETRVPDPEAVIARLPRGAAVIFRNYNDPRRVETGKRLRALCKARGVIFLVAGSLLLADRLQADGVHWPEHALLSGRRARSRSSMLVTAAAHGEPALRRAEHAGVDAVLVSPVFATKSHRSSAGLGILRFAALAAKTRVPVYSLGGITEKTAQRLVVTKAIGVAAIGAFI